MTTRTDPQVYHVDIVDKKTGETQRAEVAAWWTDDAPTVWRRMCDCQLAAYRQLQAPKNMETGPHYFDDDWPNGRGRFAACQNEYLQQNDCTHKPSRKFTVVRAYLPDDQVIEL